MHEGGMESNWESTFSEDEFTHIPPGARVVPRNPPLLVYPTPWRYQGDHGNQVRERVETRMLFWLSKWLQH